MSTQITTAFVEQYSSNISMLSQQKQCRFAGKVRSETQTGETAFYEQIGATAAVERTSRHSDTPRVDSIHSRRAVTFSTYEWADLIDRADKVKMLSDPTSSYAMSAVAAMNRSKDDVVIAAALGIARTGQKGETNIALPSSQKIEALSSGLTIEKLILTKELFGENEVDEDMPLYLACSAKQISNLLNEDKLTNSDYANVKALVRGEIDTFMGFTFTRTQRLPTDGNGDRQVFAWAHDGLLLTDSANIDTKIDQLPTKSYSTQVFRAEDFGATRMEEEKVVEIACVEA